MDKICPYCQSQHLIKNGSAYGVPTRRAAPAKWKCQDCGRQTSFKPPRGEPLWKKETAVLLYNPDKGFSGCGFELIAGLKVELGLERVDLVGGDGRDDVNEGVDDGSMLGQIEG